MRRWMIMVVAGCGLGILSLAQTLPPAGTMRPPPPLPPELPQPILPASPAEYVRALLRMSPAQRETSLAAQAPERQKFYRDKLQEYEALSPEERDARLTHTQMQGYFQFLVRQADSQRAPLVESIPAPFRLLVAARLREWDALPKDLQQDVLANQVVMRYFARTESGVPDRTVLLASAPAASRGQLEQHLSRWETLAPERRDRMYAQFQRFFLLEERQQAKALRVLAPPERERAEKTLQTYGGFSPDERQRLLVSFRKYSSLSQSERERFQQNAARWRAMPAKDRETWRRVAAQLPPLPPGLETGWGRAPGSPPALPLAPAR